MKRLLLAAGIIILAAAHVVAPAWAQKSKDTLRFPIADGESYLDSYLGPGAFQYTWAPSVYDSLLGFEPNKQEFESLLAKAWAQPAPTVYEYELRDGIKWHDGQALTADDVVYTINYLINPKSTNIRYKANWAWIDKIEKLGPMKVRITSKRPVPDGMMWMVSSTPIYPEHVHGPLENKQDFGAKPVGTGPYRVTRLEKNAGIYLEKNQFYQPVHAKPAASIGKVIGEPIPDAGSVVAAMLVGKADMAVDLPADQADALRESGRFEISLAPPAVAYNFIGFPMASWPNAKMLADPRVRLAIVKAIDRNALLQAQYGPLAKGLKPQEALCSKEQLGCGYTKPVPDYDPAGAKKLLAEAGYPDGFDITISTHPTSVIPATAISGMLRAVGIRASVKPHQIIQRVQMINSGKVEIGFYGWSGGAIFEVSSQILRHFGSKEYDDPVLTQMATETLSMTDDAERRKAVAKVFDYATDHAYAFAMEPLRSVYTHTKEIKLNNTNEIRESQIAAVHDFSWK